MRLKELKSLYYQERLKLEAMPVYQQESRLNLIRLKKSMLEKVRERLSVSEIEGRTDISEKAKDKFLGDHDDRKKFEEQIEKSIGDELDTVEREREEELQDVRYSLQEFSGYLFQLEKVAALENTIVEAQSYPGMLSDDLYEEVLKEKDEDKQGGIK